MFRTAKSLAAQETHSPRLRYAMDRVMQDMMDEYRDMGGEGGGEGRSGHAEGARQAAAAAAAAGAAHVRVPVAPWRRARQQRRQEGAALYGAVPEDYRTNRGRPRGHEALVGFATCVLTW